MNRLEDSLILWKTIVSSDVLRGVQLILVSIHRYTSMIEDLNFSPHCSSLINVIYCRRRYSVGYG